MRSNTLKLVAIIGLGVILSAILYLGMVSWLGGSQGFPLDDAWIHQTYARNLAQDGRWSYESGHASAGSTSPLWTLAITAGYILGVDYRLWTFVMGASTLALTAWLAWRVTIRLFGLSPPVGLLAALFCVLEWHLVWAAFSGMETLLFAALVLLCVDRYLAFEEQERSRLASVASSGGILEESGKPRWLSGLWMGLCGSLLVLTRPEGLLLLGLIGVCFLWERWRGKAVSRGAGSWALIAVLACLVLLALYVLFNFKTSGFIFPTTFYAKQAEYRSMIESLSLLARFGTLLLAVWVGPQILLVPGFLFSVGFSIKRQRPEMVLLWAWWLCSIGIYAFRLPVTYQHGRYLIPTIPVFVVLGVWGTWRVVRSAGGSMVTRVVTRAWMVALVALLLIFWFIGARAYARDVGFIYGEMGTIAHWLRENVSPQSRLAVHDIGMVGYRLERPFIDLAGLVTPEVIPFIDDEERLLDFMESEQVDYVVVFPDWSDVYRRVVRDPRLVLVYSTHYTWTLSAGQENLSVYRADWSLKRQLR